MQRFGHNADAAIFDFDAQPVFVCVIVAAQAQGHAAVLGEFHRIADQITQYLAQARRVGQYRRRHVWRDLGAERNSLDGRGRQKQLQDVLGDLAGVEGHGLQIEFAGLHLGKIEHIIDHVEQGLA